MQFEPRSNNPFASYGKPSPVRPAHLLALISLLPLAAAQDPAVARDPRNFTWIEKDVLALGGGGLTEADVDWLYDAGFRAIADFRAEHSDPAAYIRAKGMTFLDMPIDSASHINETQLTTFVAWAGEQQAAKRPIYIHCTNGWHRAAMFAVAWGMAREQETADHEAREVTQARPGAVMRGLAGLLDYEATLRQRDGLAVVLVSPTTHPGLNGTMPAFVDVYAAGVPAAGAAVRVWSEESRLQIDGVTDANGRFAFTYRVPTAAFMDHLYARASLEGFIDGADNVDFIFGESPKTRGAIQVTSERTPDGLVAQVTKDGRALPARIVALAPGWNAMEASAEGRVKFPAPPTGAIRVLASVWGAEPGETLVAAVAAAPPLVVPTPTPVATPSPQVIATPTPTAPTPATATPSVIVPTAPTVIVPMVSPTSAPPITAADISSPSGSITIGVGHVLPVLGLVVGLGGYAHWRQRRLDAE